MRLVLLALAVGAPLAGCATTSGNPSPENRAVSAVVQDEAQRQEAAAAANATKSSSDAMAKVGDGPKDQPPIP